MMKIKCDSSRGYGYSRAHLECGKFSGVVSENERYFQDQLIDGHCTMMLDHTIENYPCNGCELNRESNPDIIAVLSNFFLGSGDENKVVLDDRKIIVSYGEQDTYTVDISEKNENIKELINLTASNSLASSQTSDNQHE